MKTVVNIVANGGWFAVEMWREPGERRRHWTLRARSRRVIATGVAKSEAVALKMAQAVAEEDACECGSAGRLIRTRSPATRPEGAGP